MKFEKDPCEYGNRKEFETDVQPRDSISVLSGVREEVTNEQDELVLIGLCTPNCD